MKKTLALAFGLLATTACTHLETPLASREGAALAQNFAAQAVNPAATPGAPTPDPALTAAAIKRYQTDEVKTGEAEGAPLLVLNLAPTAK